MGAWPPEFVLASEAEWVQHRFNSFLGGAVVSETLRSWKEISSYAGASVRTLQRWEREFHLPIRRIATKKGSVVFAFRSDLDAWFRARTQTAEMMAR